MVGDDETSSQLLAQRTQENVPSWGWLGAEVGFSPEAVCSLVMGLGFCSPTADASSDSPCLSGSLPGLGRTTPQGSLRNVGVSFWFPQ